MAVELSLTLRGLRAESVTVGAIGVTVTDCGVAVPVKLLALSATERLIVETIVALLVKIPWLKVTEKLPLALAVVVAVVVVIVAPLIVPPVAPGKLVA